MNPLKKVSNFLTEVKTELSKVSWSTRDELVGSTMVVIVFTSIVAVFIFIVDTALAKLLSILFKG